MNVGGKLTFIVSVDKGGLEKCTSSEILLYSSFEILLIIAYSYRRLIAEDMW